MKHGHSWVRLLAVLLTRPASSSLATLEQESWLLFSVWVSKQLHRCACTLHVTVMTSHADEKVNMPMQVGMVPKYF
jgi:hypothetical protein